MDITEYPAKLKKYDDQLNLLKKEKESLEYQLLKKKTKLITEIDKFKYKSNQIRENFINLSIVNDYDCDNMTLRLLDIAVELRDISAQHAEMRRKYRILENEYMSHGVRTFEACHVKYEITS